jgi:hypothetical protein
LDITEGSAEAMADLAATGGSSPQKHWQRSQK